MSDDNKGPKPPIPFPQPAGVPIVGQPFSIVSIYCPITATITCHCGGPDTTVSVVLSVAASCPRCHKSYNLALNPTTGKIEMQVGVPTEQVPS
jgi:hypothetical protein